MKKNLNRVYFFIQTIYCLRHYFKLKKAFKPFKNKGLIQFKPHNLYVHGYISKSYPIKSRIRIGTYHYNFLHEKFSPETIDQLFQQGIPCWNVEIGSENYSVTLKKEEYEGEGSLSLLFQVDDLLLYFLRFSIGPDVNNLEDSAIHVGTIQGTRNVHHIQKVKEYFDDIYPPKILITIIESIAQVLGIKTIIGTSSEDQISFKKTPGQNKIYFLYESFYESIGGQKNVDGCYSISCPFHHKPIALIKQNHRRRALVKREKLQAISTLSSELLNKSINVTDRVKVSKDSSTTKEWNVIKNLNGNRIFKLVRSMNVRKSMNGTFN